MNISHEFPDSFHRVTIKGMCVRQGRLLLVKESTKLSGKWELPGGGLDFGEDIKEGFKREIKEEMGLQIGKISRSPVYVWTHKFEKKRGLEWFFSFVTAFRIEFKNLDFTPTDECEEIRFFSAEELCTIELCGQTKDLPGIFDPADFSEAF